MGSCGCHAGNAGATKGASAGGERPGVDPRNQQGGPGQVFGAGQTPSLLLVGRENWASSGWPGGDKSESGRPWRSREGKSWGSKDRALPSCCSGKRGGCGGVVDEQKRGPGPVRAGGGQRDCPATRVASGSDGHAGPAVCPRKQRGEPGGEKMEKSG